MPALAKQRGDCAIARAAVQPGAVRVEKPSSSVEDGRGTVPPALVTLGWTAKGGNPFQFARSVSEKPFLRDRGVTIFTMNRAYFEGHLHDEQFWVRYFDMFAQNRINELVLTFGYEDGGYMAPPYPYFFDVDGFPDVKVVGLDTAGAKSYSCEGKFVPMR